MQELCRKNFYQSRNLCSDYFFGLKQSKQIKWRLKMNLVLHRKLKCDSCGKEKVVEIPKDHQITFSTVYKRCCQCKEVNQVRVKTDDCLRDVCECGSEMHSKEETQEKFYCYFCGGTLPKGNVSPTEAKIEMSKTLLRLRRRGKYGEV